MSYVNAWYDDHKHVWRDVDGQGNSELFTATRCDSCGISGERDETTGDVFYPAT